MPILPTLRFIASHPLSSRRPLSAYWRYARWQVESRLRREVEFEWIGGARLIVSNGMTGATGNIYCGLHEFEDMAFVLHLLRPDDLFVDVGANIGSYTVLASAVCGARSVAIEPDPGTANLLRRNISANSLYDRVTVVEAAAGAKQGIASFTVGHDTMNRMASDNDVVTRKVTVQTLDAVLCGKDPIMIKMDVEGYEAEVFAAASATLERSSLAAIITETADSRVRKMLQSAGFHEVIYRPFDRSIDEVFPASDRRNAAHNTLFVRGTVVRERIATATQRRAAGVLV